MEIWAIYLYSFVNQSAIKHKGGGAVFEACDAISNTISTGLQLFCHWFFPYDNTAQSAFSTGGTACKVSE
jgi:hypothetical protein